MPTHPEPANNEVRIGPAGTFGVLNAQPDARGVVILAHGGDRFSPPDTYVADRLGEAGVATLRLDLLSPEEEHDRKKVFDIELQASRLIAATHWIEEQPQTRGLPIGYFGSNTGAGAALLAAAELGREIAVVVSLGGRPDLAMDDLPDVTAPTLLIVGGDDEPVIALNRRAKHELEAPSELMIVPGASHQFEEPGALDQAVGGATAWFQDHFRGVSPEELHNGQPRGRDLR
jgi:putative phosphoribosyl transferase